MKNKLLCTLLLAPIVCAISGCSSNQNQPFLTYGMDNGTATHELINLTYGDLQIRMDENGELLNECFLLLVLPKSCTCRETSQATMRNYSKAYKTAVYVIENTEFKNYDSYGINTSSNNSLLYIIKEGKIIKDFMYGSSAMLKEVDYTHQQISKYVKSPKNYFYTTQEHLDAMISSKEELIVEYIWSFCGDCLYGNPHILWEFAKDKTFNNKVYVLDIGSLTFYNGEFSTSNEVYTKFLHDHYLSEAASSEYGYLTGKVPTIQYWNDGKLEDAAVIFNDVFQEKENGKFEIINSFYTEERIPHLKYWNDTLSPLVGKETNNNYNHAEMLADYKAIIEAFLTYYAL